MPIRGIRYPKVPTAAGIKPGSQQSLPGKHGWDGNGRQTKPWAALTGRRQCRGERTALLAWRTLQQAETLYKKASQPIQAAGFCDFRRSNRPVQKIQP